MARQFTTVGVLGRITPAVSGVTHPETVGNASLINVERAVALGTIVEITTGSASTTTAPMLVLPFGTFHTVVGTVLGTVIPALRRGVQTATVAVA